ncbi:tRNA glutamyl-Q(34) synthetase GluQRS [Pseudophaeobacter arcticus]|uniref:tRNA glutamyl-Q(34) synthetase GluQRS n=1 Tax=Pseudophaeobacter arcticus TaxID=385492 RepID=UPI003A97E16B
MGADPVTFTTRFAPSPTGPLHLGHAYSALLAYDMAMAEGGKFMLRIDDLDQGRSRAVWEQQIYEDLKWLGIAWSAPVRKQSECQADYDQALDVLWRKGLLYACSCSRRDIKEAQSAPQEGQPLLGPDGLIYPGTCRPHNSPSEPRPQNVTLRLDVTKALAPQQAGCHFSPRAGDQMAVAAFQETGPRANTTIGQYEFSSEYILNQIGDFVVARQHMGASYHLAVVVDDQDQGVTHVVRGEDLLEATIIQVLIGWLLDDEIEQYWLQPVYHHHRLIRDEAGKRLAKRDDARAIAKYRRDGASPKDIRQLVGLD